MIDPKTITHIKTFHDSFDGDFEIKTQIVLTKTWYIMVLNYKIDNLFKDLDVLDNYPATDSSDQCMDTGHTTNGSQMSECLWLWWVNDTECKIFWDSDSDILLTRWNAWCDWVDWVSVLVFTRVPVATEIPTLGLILYIFHSKLRQFHSK